MEKSLVELTKQWIKEIEDKNDTKEEYQEEQESIIKQLDLFI